MYTTASVKDFFDLKIHKITWKLTFLKLTNFTLTYNVIITLLGLEKYSSRNDFGFFPPYNGESRCILNLESLVQ